MPKKKWLTILNEKVIWLGTKFLKEQIMKYKQNFIKFATRNFKLSITLELLDY